MIRTTELFKNKEGFVLITGVVCVLILSAVLHINRLTAADSPEPTANSNTGGYRAAVLMQFKSKYVGDHVNVRNLIGNLPYAEYSQGGISLQTEKAPYGITVNYDFGQANDNTGSNSNTNIDINQVETGLRHNAVVIFALIDNADVIDFNSDLGSQNLKVRYARAELQKSFPQDLRDYAKNQGELQILLNSFHLKVLVYPQKYAMTMSGTPGIRLLAQYDGAAGQVQYSADKGNIEYVAGSGQLLNWDSAGGKVSEKGARAEFPLGTPAYWSPHGMINQFGVNTQSQIPIRISVMQNGSKAAEKQVIIHFDGLTAFFTVEPSNDVIVSKDFTGAAFQG